MNIVFHFGGIPVVIWDILVADIYLQVFGCVGIALRDHTVWG